MSTSTRTRFVVLAVFVQLLLVGVAVAGQLSARLTGDEYLLRVGPVDPIDPFRGAYVDLFYPDIQPEDGIERRDGRVYVVLREDDGVWVADDWTTERPDEGLYLSCSDRSWQLKCGIESLFLSQDEAARVQKDINQSGLFPQEFDEHGNPITPDQDSGYAARVRIDRWGNASVVELVKR